VAKIGSGEYIIIVVDWDYKFRFTISIIATLCFAAMVTMTPNPASWSASKKQS
jgi:hypothetical protein